MGAEPNPTRRPTTSGSPFLPLLFAIVALIIAALHPWEKVAYTDEQGKPKLHPRHQEELDRVTQAEDIAEQYALRAIGDGNYICNCPEGFYYLHTGEIWKYGTTKNGAAGRYSSKFLKANNVYYDMQFTGTLHECLIQEQIKIRSYPLLPENVARPVEKRLVRPCANFKNL